MYDHCLVLRYCQSVLLKTTVITAITLARVPGVLETTPASRACGIPHTGRRILSTGASPSGLLSSLFGALPRYTDYDTTVGSAAKRRKPKPTNAVEKYVA